MNGRHIILKGVRVHNLKGVDLTLTHGELIVFTGVSGSGKSSLAFDTIFVEGQRRYIESLSHQARRYLGDFPKPEAAFMGGISPTIAIEQKTAGRSPRSSVGTMTGIYDFLRLLFARIAIPHCPVSKEPVAAQSKEKIIKKIELFPEKTKLVILAPYAKNKKGEFKDDFAQLLQRGFTKVRVDGEMMELTGEENLDGTKSHTVEIVVDRIVVEKETFPRLAEAVTQALDLGQGFFSVLNAESSEVTDFSQFAYSAKSNLSYGPLEPQDFSFNHPSGMCPECQGLGESAEFDIEKIIDLDLSINEDCCKIASSYQTVRYGNIYDNLGRIYGFDIKKPWKKLSQEAKNVFLYGTKEKWTKMRFVHPLKKMRWTEFVRWQGVLQEARKRLNEAKSDAYRKKMQEWMKQGVCKSCDGARIKPYPAHAKLAGKTIAEITNFTLQDAQEFFQNIHLPKEEMLIAEEIFKEILKRLSFLCSVGLSYLSLSRNSPTLSGGEAQRVRLASQIGSSLVGATYILDEPSIGLHPSDHEKLIHTLLALRDLGNTVIVVEHDRDTMLAADTIVDVGPGAGKEGGKVLSSTTLKALINQPESLTGKYLTYTLEIPIPKKRKLQMDGIKIFGAEHHNLKKIDVNIPLKGFIGITGVSGSGKSSLISDILFPALSNELHHSQLPIGKHKKIEGLEHITKVIAVDQSPIGRTPRSNAATYIKLFDDIRDLFSSLPESQVRGFSKGHFSFNMPEGSCPSCGGVGSIRIDMDFLEDAWMECPQCKGKRFDSDVLAVRLQGHSIADILEMDVANALIVFSAYPHIRKKLELLDKVGLSYLSLGQPSNTLSGGEAQRIKLAKELSRPPSGQTLYILDEPSTGLHFHDLKRLLSVVHELIDLGNTAIVIEHNMDVIKTADWVIDLGPGAGIHGGRINGEGSPEKIAELSTPTGKALGSTLQNEPLLFKSSQKTLEQKPKEIIVENAQENNLKNVSIKLPHSEIIVFTGPSGSGKTSLAFDTIYAEGQRRYLESLSSYARQFVKIAPKPKVERIEGLAPTIAIEQHKGAVNPRSTIGTLTEIYDLLRLLYAHLGTAYSPETGEEIKTISKDFVVQKTLKFPANEKIQILAPLELKKETFPELLERLRKEGYLRIRLNKEYWELDQEIPFDARRKNEILLVIDRLVVQDKVEKRLSEAVGKATNISNGLVVLAREKEDLFFNLAFAEESTGKSYPPITPLTFSFNDEQGMCLECRGLGTVYGISGELYDELLQYSVEDLYYELGKENVTSKAWALLKDYFTKEKIDLHLPLKKWPQDKLSFFLHGEPPTAHSTKSGFSISWKGILPALSYGAKSGETQIRASLIPLMQENPCPACLGMRLNPLARNVKIHSVSIADFCFLPLDQAFLFLKSLSPLLEEKPFLIDGQKQILDHLEFLIEIGLSYLSLHRSAPTLSGGELQRIRLAKQLGSGLTSCIYVLDEPTIGLHPHNNHLLNAALQKLKKLGNTLLIVEHDPMTVQIADQIVDFGPKAGKLGGKILAQGTLSEILANPNSITGAYLSGRKKIPIPKERRERPFGLSVKNASLHNLKGIDVEFPLEAITCITGVSGSGKSSLMQEIIRPALQESLRKKNLNEITIAGSTVSGLKNFDKLIVIDQNPISVSLRSDVVSYSETLASIRTFYAGLKLAKTKGLRPMHFSYNHRRGMCKTCWGLGYKTIDLQFLPKVKVTCESCQGFRLNPVSLQVKYKEKHLGELLKFSVEEARNFFSEIPPIYRKLDTLISVGLGYLQLGQEIATLSGGESQRIRLARELSKRATGKTLYLIDEPSVGLHSEDLMHLIPIFHRLADKKNTLFIIEHNLDLIANADYLIDLGPEAGEKGGHLVAKGTPEEVAQNSLSYTGKYLQKYFQPLLKKKK